MKIKLTRTHEFMKDLQVGKVYDVAREEGIGVIVIDDVNENNFIDKGFYEVVEEDDKKLKITITPVTESKRVLDKCRLTVNKEPSKNPRPSETFLDNIYMTEHSPIREKLFDIYIENIPYCISTHFARHHQGIEKYCTTSRSDRTDIKDRSQRSQMDLISMGITVNSQALINMSKVRLCWCADKDARKVMFEIVRQIKELEPELGSKLVPSCVYRNFCSENNKDCGYSREFLRNWREEYLNGREQLL